MCDELNWWVLVMSIAIKRVYELPSPSDGMRILVDRLWPRGVSKQRAAIDLWMKEISPSVALRQWFGHRAEHWLEFSQRYRQELLMNPALETLKSLMNERQVTLIYAAKDPQMNHALVIQQLLDECS